MKSIKLPDFNHVLSMMFVVATLRCITQLVKIGHIEVIPVIESALVIGFIAMFVWAASETFQEIFGRIDGDD